jgi:hypothetical protein
VRWANTVQSWRPQVIAFVAEMVTFRICWVQQFADLVEMIHQAIILHTHTAPAFQGIQVFQMASMIGAS